MKLTFDSIDEVRAFLAEFDGEDEGAGTTQGGVAPGKRKRRTRAEIEADRLAQAAGNMQGNPNVQPQQGFTPPTGAQQGGFGQAQPQQGFAAPPPNFGQQQQPQVHPLVTAIIAKADAAIASGQKVDDITNWFRGSLGPEAAQLNWEQIKVIALPKASEPTLTNIAKLLNVTA